MSKRLTAIFFAAATAAIAQDGRPRVAVKALSPIQTEVMQWLGEKCPPVLVTSRESAAQYVLRADPGEKKGVQFVILLESGDMLKGGSSRTIKGAAKDACRIIETDWQEKHEAPRPSPTSAQP